MEKNGKGNRDKTKKILFLQVNFYFVIVLILTMLPKIKINQGYLKHINDKTKKQNQGISLFI